MIGGTIVTWLQNTEKFVSRPLARVQQRERRRRRGRLEPDGEEHDVACRASPTAMRSASSGEYDEAHVGAARLRLEQVPVAAGDAHHVAERREDHAGRLGDRDGVVDAAHRDHADRAARAVHQLDGLGQDVLDAVPVDRVRVPAAHLHELEVVVARRAR